MYIMGCGEATESNPGLLSKRGLARWLSRGLRKNVLRKYCHLVSLAIWQIFPRPGTYENSFLLVTLSEDKLLPSVYDLLIFKTTVKF